MFDKRSRFFSNKEETLKSKMVRKTASQSPWQPTDGQTALKHIQTLLVIDKII